MVQSYHFLDIHPHALKEWSECELMPTPLQTVGDVRLVDCLFVQCSNRSSFVLVACWWLYWPFGVGVVFDVRAFVECDDGSAGLLVG